MQLAANTPAHKEGCLSRTKISPSCPVSPSLALPPSTHATHTSSSVFSIYGKTDIHQNNRRVSNRPHYNIKRHSIEEPDFKKAPPLSFTQHKTLPTHETRTVRWSVTTDKLDTSLASAIPIARLYKASSRRRVEYRGKTWATAHHIARRTWRVPIQREVTRGLPPSLNGVQEAITTAAFNSNETNNPNGSVASHVLPPLPHAMSQRIAMQTWEFSP
jgi:hypothetical protein